MFVHTVDFVGVEIPKYFLVLDNRTGREIKIVFCKNGLEEIERNLERVHSKGRRYLIFYNNDSHQHVQTLILNIRLSHRHCGVASINLDTEKLDDERLIKLIEEMEKDSVSFGKIDTARKSSDLFSDNDNVFC